MDQIDLNNTLIKGRLIYKKKFLTILEISSFAIVLGCIGYIFPLMFSLNNGVEQALVWLLIILMSYGLSVLKWNYTMRVKKTRTNQTKKENRRLIESYIDGKGFEYGIRNDNHVQSYSNREMLGIRMELNFIIRDKEIHLNACYWGTKFTMPSILRIDEIIRDLNGAQKNSSAKPTA